MNEFELIAKLTHALPVNRSVVTGAGDDWHRKRRSHPVKVAPNKCKVVLDNQYVRVLRWSEVPGDKVPMHEHPALALRTKKDASIDTRAPEVTCPPDLSVEASRGGSASVWRFLGSAAKIRRTSGQKPMSSIRSASSSTKISM